MLRKKMYFAIINYGTDLEKKKKTKKTKKKQGKTWIGKSS